MEIASHLDRTSPSYCQDAKSAGSAHEKCCIVEHWNRFFQILFYIIKDKQCDDIISWDLLRDSFTIHRVEKFEQKLLRRYFLPEAMTSFLTQMTACGFEVVSICDSVTIFRHPCFQLCCNEKWCESVTFEKPVWQEIRLSYHSAQTKAGRLNRYDYCSNRSEIQYRNRTDWVDLEQFKYEIIDPAAFAAASTREGQFQFLQNGLWAVDAVLAKRRGKNGHPEYLVKWKKDMHPESWEHARNVPNWLVNRCKEESFDASPASVESAGLGSWVRGCCTNCEVIGLDIECCYEGCKKWYHAACLEEVYGYSKQIIDNIARPESHWVCPKHKTKLQQHLAIDLSEESAPQRDSSKPSCYPNTKSASSSQQQSAPPVVDIASPTNNLLYPSHSHVRSLPALQRSSPPSCVNTTATVHVTNTNTSQNPNLASSHPVTNTNSPPNPVPPPHSSVNMNHHQLQHALILRSLQPPTLHLNMVYYQRMLYIQHLQQLKQYQYLRRLQPFVSQLQQGRRILKIGCPHPPLVTNQQTLCLQPKPNTPLSPPVIARRHMYTHGLQRHPHLVSQTTQTSQSCGQVSQSPDASSTTTAPIPMRCDDEEKLFSLDENLVARIKPPSSPPEDALAIDLDEGNSCVDADMEMEWDGVDVDVDIDVETERPRFVGVVDHDFDQEPCDIDVDTHAQLMHTQN